jgi:hypothetical protein
VVERVAARAPEDRAGGAGGRALVVLVAALLVARVVALAEEVLGPERVAAARRRPAAARRRTAGRGAAGLGLLGRSARLAGGPASPRRLARRLRGRCLAADGSHRLDEIGERFPRRGKLSVGRELEADALVAGRRDDLEGSFGRDAVAVAAVVVEHESGAVADRGRGLVGAGGRATVGGRAATSEVVAHAKARRGRRRVRPLSFVSLGAGRVAFGAGGPDFGAAPPEAAGPPHIDGLAWRSSI